MKNALALLLTLIAPLSLCGNFDGGYFGLAGGIAHQRTTFEVNRLYTVQAAPPAPMVTLSRGERDVENGKWNGWGEAYSGWGTTFCSRIYLGGRAGINVSSYDVRNRVEVVENVGLAPPVTFTLLDRVQLQQGVLELMADLKPGITWGECTMIFGLVGVSLGQERLKGSFNVTSAGNPPSFVAVSQRQLNAGLRVGIGIEERFSRCMSLVMSYVYGYYKELSAKGSTTAFTATGTPAPNGLQYFAKVRPRKDVLSIGLNYYF